MFPLPRKDAFKVTGRPQVFRQTRHVLLTVESKQALVTFRSVTQVQQWMVNKADNVDYLTPEDVEKCSAPVGRIVYDELHEDGHLTMRVAAGVVADNGFRMARGGVHVDATTVGRPIEWKLGLNS